MAVSTLPLSYSSPCQCAYATTTRGAGGIDDVSDDTTSQKSAVQKSDFRILRTIGRGTYGKVYLVQHIVTEQIFAMKSVLKDLLIKTDQVAGIRGKSSIAPSAAAATEGYSDSEF